MHNAPKPNVEDLPTKPQLRRYTIIAVVAAVAIGVMVYLPAEHGVDPTGVGSILGLTEMGEIKQQLAEEAAADELLHSEDESSSQLDDAPTPPPVEVWKDEITFTLASGAATEIKATMKEGATLNYAWLTSGGGINFDLHAHAGGENVSYEKGRGQTSGVGSFETPFAGNHGWFWRNRNKSDVTVRLQLRGDYSGIVRSD